MKIESKYKSNFILVHKETLRELQATINSFYTATCTNAKGRDSNREYKNHALSIIERELNK